MSKESGESKPVNSQQESDYIPFKFPIMVTPFNAAEVISIHSMNERHKPRLKEESKKV